MTKKLTTADLMRELDALKKKVAELEARPAQSVEHHYHYPQQPTYTPWYNPTYRPYWGTVTAVPCTNPSTTLTWTSGYATTSANAENSPTFCGTTYTVAD